MFETVLLPLLSLFPLAAALLIGLGILAGKLDGEAAEALTARLAMLGCGASLLANGVLLAAGKQDAVQLGEWLHSGDYRIAVNFLGDRLSLGLAGLFAGLCLLVLRFAQNYMHRESGYHRFFFVLSLFSAAMQWLVTAGNGVLAFVGWELAGVCSYLLIAFFYEKHNAVYNATRVFVTNRIGDGGFIAGLALSFLWLGGIDWQTINHGAAQLGDGQRFTLCLCFLLAAMAKSAQVPLAPWLSRAMEGPTPSSAVFYGAVMVHAGVYLLLRLEPLFSTSPGAMGLLLVVGVATAGYGYVAGLVQTDVKSALIFATSGQVGLMFAECGLGLWDVAVWHLAAHAVVRGYQFLAAPSLMHDTLGLPMRGVPAWLAQRRLLYTMALQRFWLDALADWTLTEPCRRLSRDMSRFDERVVNRFIGLPQPAMRALSSLAQWEERRLGAYDAEADEVIRAPGLFGHLTRWLTAQLHRFETQWILQGMGEGWVRQGMRLGPGLNRLDDFLGQPRYVLLLIVATLLMVL
jgi:NADH:ubiquinone oxidoreductase subunit 5 (subunit L)/multisubunit Na+/H+ antiporter MnhA subunit